MGIYTNTLANTRNFMSRGMGSQYVRKVGELAAAVFGIKGDSGTDNITQGETLTFTGGTNITTAVTSNKVTINSDTSGDVVGPGSATDNAMCIYDGTTGKLLGVGTITDDGAIVTLGTSDVRFIDPYTLPDADPSTLGQIYTDGAVGPGTPRALWVSGGP